MKILISALFYPSTGGIETVVALLAHEWTAMGHEVQVVTYIPSVQNDEKTFPFTVVRQPSARELLNLVDWCDIYLQANISLKTVWPLLLKRRVFVVTHQTGYRRESGRIGWQDAIKLRVMRKSINIACSEATARDLPVPCTVIGNPYDETKFCISSRQERKKDLVFVGRLVSDKGTDLLLDALALLRQQNLTPDLTIIGDGPEREPLEAQMRALQLESQVTFVGRQQPTQVAELLNAHKVMVVPSLWNEPFGVVALEGIACGCLVVGSEGGGLKDAIGPCGVTFPNGDVSKLAQAISRVLNDSELVASLRSHASEHLLRHRTPFIARQYMGVITQNISK